MKLLKITCILAQKCQLLSVQTTPRTSGYSGKKTLPSYLHGCIWDPTVAVVLEIKESIYLILFLV